MPIKQSAIKTLRQEKRRTSRNRARKVAYRSAIKELEVVVEEKKKKEAADMLATVHKAIDKAAKAGVIKDNAAGRYKARTQRLVSSIQ